MRTQLLALTATPAKQSSSAGNLQPGLLAFQEYSVGESVRLQPRFEAFNLLNHPHFGTPGSYVNGSSFGVINSAGPGRIVQVAMKLIW